MNGSNHQTRTLEHLKARKQIVDDVVSDVQQLANVLANDNLDKSRKLIKARTDETYREAMEELYGDEQFAAFLTAFSTALLEACHNAAQRAVAACETQHRGPKLILPPGVRH